MFKTIYYKRYSFFVSDALAAAGIQPSVAAALAAQLVGGVSQMANPGQPMTSVLHVTNLNEEVRKCCIRIWRAYK